MQIFLPGPELYFLRAMYCYGSAYQYWIFQWYSHIELEQVAACIAVIDSVRNNVKVYQGWHQLQGKFIGEFSGNEQLVHKEPAIIGELIFFLESCINVNHRIPADGYRKTFVTGLLSHYSAFGIKKTNIFI